MASIIEIFHTSKQTLIAIEKFIAAGSLLFLLLLTLIQIIARNFFETGFAQLDVVTKHLVLFIMFMGAALACEGNSHIKIDVLCAYLPQDKKNKLIKPLFLLSSIITLIFAWYSAIFWLDEWNYATGNQYLSVFMALILPCGFIVLGLHFLLLALLGLNSQAQSSA